MGRPLLAGGCRAAAVRAEPPPERTPPRFVESNINKDLKPPSAGPTWCARSPVWPVGYRSSRGPTSLHSRATTARPGRSTSTAGGTACPMRSAGTTTTGGGVLAGPATAPPRSPWIARVYLLTIFSQVTPAGTVATPEGCGAKSGTTRSGSVPGRRFSWAVAWAAARHYG